jgi:predicted DsbA family dithiol-disulfide isomerase
MGGLLPSWDDCKGKIRSPSDAARLWNQMGRSYGMPINGDIWIDDPLSSSFPPSIAFKAAQLQDRDQATLFLRRIREMLFLEKKNIMDWQFIESAARDTGLDIARLRMDYEGAARTAFEEDLRLAARLEVTSFPTLIFTGPYGNGIRLKGYQRYQDLELAILQLLPFARKQEFDKEPQSLFRHFPTMVEAEFALLSDLVRKEARVVLQQLSDNGFIDKMMTPNGVLWKTRG